MIPERHDTHGGDRAGPADAVDEARTSTAGPAPGDDAASIAAEVDELGFLVGTSCSRTITLLMQSEADWTALRDELEFLAERAGRLAALLGRAQGTGRRGAP